MLQALIITLREGVEAALIVGIALAYLAKIQRPELRRTVYAALIAAFLASVGVAVVISQLNLNQDIFEGSVMLVAAVLTVTMIVFMARTARFLKGKIEQRVGSLAGEGSRIGLFAFVFFMVLREGVETVLILAGVSFESSALMSFLGTLIGVALAVLFGVVFVKGSVRINLQKFFRVTTIILLFVVAQLVVSGLHELSENGVLPSSRREMALIGPIVRNELFFVVTILALTAVMVLMEWRRRTPTAVASESVAEQRKARWAARRERLWLAAVYVCTFAFIAMITAEFIYAKSVSALSPPAEIPVVAGQVSVPVSAVSDGRLQRYVTHLRDGDVRFLLYRKPDGDVVALLDACEICGGIGFYETKTGLVCKNCAAPVNPQAVGQAGGCNPIPLKSSISGGSLLISEAELNSGLRYFQR